MGKRRVGKAWRGPWLVRFFRRHRDDDPAEAIPAQAFLNAAPKLVHVKLVAIVSAVAEAPPPVFAGGGKWEAMHGSMSGIYEVRADGSGREHFRLFCVLERDGAAVGLGGPTLVLVTGMKKGFMTTFSERDYDRVRVLVAEFFARVPRSVS